MNLVVGFFLKKWGIFTLLISQWEAARTGANIFSGEIPKQIHGLYSAKIKTIEKQKYKQYQKNNMINTPRFTQDIVH